MKNFFKPTVVTWVVVIFILLNQFSTSISFLPHNEIASYGAFFKYLILFNFIIATNLSYPFFWFNDAFVYDQQNLFVHVFMLLLSPVLWISLLYTLASSASWLWRNLSLLVYKKLYFIPYGPRFENTAFRSFSVMEREYISN